MMPSASDTLAQAPSSSTGIAQGQHCTEPASTSAPRGAHSYSRLIIRGKLAGSELKLLPS